MQQFNIKIKGLQTNHSELTAQDGALQIANNVVIDSPNTVTSRRGFNKYGNQFNSANTFYGMFNFEDKIIVHNDSTLSYDSDDAGTWTDYTGTYDAPDNKIGIRSVSKNGSAFFTTTTGIKKLEAYDDEPRNAGVPKGISIVAALSLRLINK
jgi:hypothetical protein